MRPLRRPFVLAFFLAGTAAAVLGGCGRPDGRPATWYGAPVAARPEPDTASAARRYRPDEDLGPLFAAVQLGGVYPDGKTFVDAVPNEAPAAIRAAYREERGRPGFRLDRFVAARFTPPTAPRPSDAAAPVAPAQRMEDHLRALWPALTRTPDAATGATSLIPLPHPYVVPGGRFREVYYWDSYFTMLGLVASGRTDLVRGMLDNFAHLLRTVGHVPNGNRTYYLTRSQPPFFSSMVALLAGAEGPAAAAPYLDALEREHAFWMAGEADLPAAGPGAVRHVVRLPSGAVLNRYWDAGVTPRPESYREDFTLAQGVPEADRPRLWKDLRSAAESGWDFSSRWFADGRTLGTIETTAIVPVDLNALLYHLEATMARLHRAGGDAGRAAAFERRAEARRAALLATFWDEADGYFHDVYALSGRPTGRASLAGVVPLYYGLATDAQAARVADRVRRSFLGPGGFVTTTVRTGQQWDAPNGWAPLQWLTVRGLERYGHAALAAEGRDRWLALNRAVYGRTGRMMEKYNVLDTGLAAGGGEYPTQDGFGWTNGVALGFTSGLRVRP